jgi:hypothetical protein
MFSANTITAYLNPILQPLMKKIERSCRIQHDFQDLHLWSDGAAELSKGTFASPSNPNSAEKINHAESNLWQSESVAINLRRLHAVVNFECGSSSGESCDSLKEHPDLLVDANNVRIPEAPRMRFFKLRTRPPPLEMMENTRLIDATSDCCHPRFVTAPGWCNQM